MLFQIFWYYVVLKIAKGVLEIGSITKTNYQFIDDIKTSCNYSKDSRLLLLPYESPLYAVKSSCFYQYY